MEFWGVEVKAGETVKAEPADESLIHLSHVVLGEIKKDKGNELVALFVKIGDQKMVLGHLSTQSNQQIAFDLVFDREVELSHNWKNGSVYFMGYETEVQDEEFNSDLDLEHQIGFANAENGSQPSDEAKAAAVAAPKSNTVKPDSSSKQKSKSVQIKDNKAEDESDEDESDEDEDDDESNDGPEEGMSVDEDSEDDEEDESESEDEETPNKAGKVKRPNDSATKTPVPAKKQKAATPQKTDVKKGGHTATPHPAKGAAKTPANGTNTKPQATKSGGKFSCGSCDRSFGSDMALQSHSKAKHGAK